MLEKIVANWTKNNKGEEAITKSDERVDGGSRPSRSVSQRLAGVEARESLLMSGMGVEAAGKIRSKEFLRKSTSPYKLIKKPKRSEPIDQEAEKKEQELNPDSLEGAQQIKSEVQPRPHDRPKRVFGSQNQIGIRPPSSTQSGVKVGAAPAPKTSKNEPLKKSQASERNFRITNRNTANLASITQRPVTSHAQSSKNVDRPTSSRPNKGFNLAKKPEIAENVAPQFDISSAEVGDQAMAPVSSSKPVQLAPKAPDTTQKNPDGKISTNTQDLPKPKPSNKPIASPTTENPTQSSKNADKPPKQEQETAPKFTSDDLISNVKVFSTNNLVGDEANSHVKPRKGIAEKTTQNPDKMLNKFLTLMGKTIDKETMSMVENGLADNAPIARAQRDRPQNTRNQLLSEPIAEQKHNPVTTKLQILGKIDQKQNSRDKKSPKIQQETQDVQNATDVNASVQEQPVLVKPVRKDSLENTSKSEDTESDTDNPKEEKKIEARYGQFSKVYTNSKFRPSKGTATGEDDEDEEEEQVSPPKHATIARSKFFPAAKTPTSAQPAVVSPSPKSDQQKVANPDVSAVKEPPVVIVPVEPPAQTQPVLLKETKNPSVSNLLQSELVDEKPADIKESNIKNLKPSSDSPKIEESKLFGAQKDLTESQHIDVIDSAIKESAKFNDGAKDTHKEAEFCANLSFAPQSVIGDQVVPPILSPTLNLLESQNMQNLFDSNLQPPTIQDSPKPEAAPVITSEPIPLITSEPKPPVQPPIALTVSSIPVFQLNPPAKIPESTLTVAPPLPLTISTPPITTSISPKEPEPIQPAPVLDRTLPQSRRSITAPSLGQTLKQAKQPPKPTFKHGPISLTSQDPYEPVQTSHKPPQFTKQTDHSVDLDAKLSKVQRVYKFKSAQTRGKLLEYNKFLKDAKCIPTRFDELSMVLNSLLSMGDCDTLAEVLLDFEDPLLILQTLPAMKGSVSKLQPQNFKKLTQVVVAFYRNKTLPKLLYPCLQAASNLDVNVSTFGSSLTNH